MSLFVLDTDHLTLLRKGHLVVTSKMAAAPAGQVVTTLVTMDEHLRGWYTQLRKANDPPKMAKAYAGLLDVLDGMKLLPVLAFPLVVAQRYFVLRKHLPRLGRNDLAIAACVLEAGAVLVTRNVGDFRQVPGLVIEDWTKP